MLHLPRPQRHLPPRIPEPAALEVAATPVPLRAAATVNVLAGSVLALAALVQLVFAMLAGENLSLSQGDVTLRPNSGAVLIARVAVMLCLGAGGFACWRARLCAKKGEAPDLARACLLGMAGGVLAALPALGSLLGVAFADELDAPVGVWALRLLIMEPFLATPGPPGAWTSVQMSPDLNPLHVLYLWPLGITLVNATARALTPSLSGALQPRDRRKELVWILFFAVAGTLLPFIPTGEGGARSDEVARRYARAVASGGDPMAMHFAWPDCPSELRAASPTNLSQLVPTPDSPVAKVRVMQRTISGPGARTGLAKYRFSYTEQGATNSALWMIIQVEVTLQDGSTREAVLALSQYGGEWRVAPPRK